MPSVIETDLDAFGSAVNDIQHVGFKKIENNLQNPIIPKIMDNLRIAGASGVGMSSFGPTIYAVTDTNATDIISAGNEVIKEVGGEIIQTRAKNSGANILR